MSAVGKFLLGVIAFVSLIGFIETFKSSHPYATTDEMFLILMFGLFATVLIGIGLGKSFRSIFFDDKKEKESPTKENTPNKIPPLSNYSFNRNILDNQNINFFLNRKFCPHCNQFVDAEKKVEKTDKTTKKNDKKSASLQNTILYGTLWLAFKWIISYSCPICGYTIDTFETFVDPYI